MLHIAYLASVTGSKVTDTGWEVPSKTVAQPESSIATPPKNNQIDLIFVKNVFTWKYPRPRNSIVTPLKIVLS